MSNMAKNSVEKDTNLQIRSEDSESLNQEINISVTFRHTDSTEALKSYAIEKINHSLKKYKVSDADVHVILSVEKRDNTAEVRVSSKRFDLSATALTEDLYSAIDKVCDNLSAQIRKQKEKSSGHRS